MKKLGVVWITLILLMAMVFPGMVVAADPAVEKEIKAVLDAYAAAFEKKDVSAIMSLFATDSNVFFVDSDTEQPFSGIDKIREAYTRDFSNMESATLKYSGALVGSKGDVAWFATGISANVTVEGEKMTVPAQWSAVLEKRGGKWLIVQSHFSFPAVEEPGPGEKQQ
jgi:uncharacterized protein (TIGR02246 family)